MKIIHHKDGRHTIILDSAEYRRLEDALGIPDQPVKGSFAYEFRRASLWARWPKREG